MPINVIMPQMGESILEGTVTKWLKKIGDKVKKEESLFEVSTDKVDTEVPSPSDGVLSRILVKEGETVQVDAVVAILDALSEAKIEAALVPAAMPQAEVEAAPIPEAAPERAVETAVISETGPGTAAEPVVVPGPAHEATIEKSTVPEVVPESAIEPTATPKAEPLLTVSGETEAKEAPVEDVVTEVESPVGATEPVKREIPAEEPAFVRASPLVRRIARDHGVDLSLLRGTGLSGRISKEDIFRYLEGRQRAAAPPEPAPLVAAASVEVPVVAPAAATPAPEEPPMVRLPEPLPAAVETLPEPRPVAPVPPAVIPKPAEDIEILDMSPMRKAIAEHMVLSRHTAAHVQTIFEVDMTAIMRLREKHADQFEARTGISLTYTPFFVKALVETVRDFPILNSSVAGDQILLKKSVNVGIAVALDTGLIVPVVMNAHLRSFSELALAIHDLAKRARTKKLKPEEVQHGTITVTNPGIFGSLLGLPIINQPQVAILCVGSLEKRPVVINDAIAIRTMAYMVLSFDHRIIDGAVADKAMSALKTKLQNWHSWRE